MTRMVPLDLVVLKIEVLHDEIQKAERRAWWWQTAFWTVLFMLIWQVVTS